MLKNYHDNKFLCLIIIFVIFGGNDRLVRLGEMINFIIKDR